MKKGDVIKYIKMRIDILKNINWDDEMEYYEALTCADGIVNSIERLIKGLK